MNHVTLRMNHVTLRMNHVTLRMNHVTLRMNHVTLRMNHVTLRMNHVTLRMNHVTYGVAVVSRIDKIIGLFCRISSVFQGTFAKETYNFIDPTNQSHPIFDNASLCGSAVRTSE